ncbi:DUF4954 family protein [Danxiaibacter flavus]|uniref:DUF4954 family protein n=1 Tax=Danxiaibacter flavus TaxID=3049108 RepID=A0ABV3ZNG4_9BACT|nr:DUF4954 family protein [Chitinophagaceae bacterium DXS]
MSQNLIKKVPFSSLGNGFIPTQFLPEGKDEYHLRNIQNRSGIDYRRLTAYEIEVLVRNGNTSADWNMILVSDAFNPELVKNCKFYGLVRIGKLEPYCLEYSDLIMPVGLYNSTIISCDFGDNVVIDNVNYLSHYIIGNEVMIVKVNELSTTNHAKFGNGIVKHGEDESIRIWLEICNENGGRSVIPFNSMVPGDAWLWSKYREDEVMLKKFVEFTEHEFDIQRGYYGKIGDRTIIKNTHIVKDVWIGSDAYIKGANKLKNLTINSGPEGRSQIGEGCELVNGIVGFGCRIFYGVKAVRFVMASHSQLKYGARLINSYLGNNATISCCEVLNSLIFPAHEQHHNNSFLCAAVVMGQSNIPAGATIGSNHNSRSPDGEIITGRGFWPGLCVSLKHNSRFACFTILAKGDYSYELDIPIPFSLVSNDLANNRLVVMPAYWFMYNMYAMARNAWKYVDRDKRVERIQKIEYDFLAPDSVNEMFNALRVFETETGRAFFRMENPTLVVDDADCREQGFELLSKQKPVVNDLEVMAEGFENNKRKTVIIKIQQSYNIFRQMIEYYGMTQLIAFMQNEDITDIQQSFKKLPHIGERNNWLNVGGQLIPSDEVDVLRKNIREGAIDSWNDLHDEYVRLGEAYANLKLVHALASLQEVSGIQIKTVSKETFNELLDKTVATKKWITENIKTSRSKDYTNPFRKMIYDSQEEMDKVLGKLDDNSFINQQQQAFEEFVALAQQLKL